MKTKLTLLSFAVLFLILLIGLAMIVEKRYQARTQTQQEDQSTLQIAANDSDAVSADAADIINSAGQVQSSQQAQQSNTTPMAPQTQAPEMSIDTEKKYSATLETTEGDIVIEFTAKETPITVNNFVSLARSDFYDGTIFHRVIDGFMIQGGDPKGDGTGGPGYRFDDEPFEGEYTRGTVALANAGPNTNGSQFFIMHQNNPLPPNYVIFGKVVEGMDVVDAIATAEVTMSRGGEPSKPVNPVKVTNVEIMEE